jgi:hypothetical protein
MIPVCASTRRISLLVKSTMNTFPSLSKAAVFGEVMATWVAKQPSPTVLYAVGQLARGDGGVPEGGVLVFVPQ